MDAAGPNSDICHGQHDTPGREGKSMHNFRIALHLTALLCLTAIFPGCHEPEVVNFEPKRADDVITEEELESFLAVANSLAEHKLPPLPEVMLPAPQWSRSRSLPVNELVKEDEKARFERNSIDWLVAHAPQSRFLKRALRREKMTIEQFIGLYLALGASLSRENVPPHIDLDWVLIRGKQAIAELKKDQRIFSSLTEDEAGFLQEASGWLPVVDRAARLRIVHPGNLALVRQHRERLAAAMPAEFLCDPLREFSAVLDDHGVPFQEPPGAESDDSIPWSRDDTIAGVEEGIDREAR
jgi:hypothetical protein